jgi:hypothetical protein
MSTETAADAQPAEPEQTRRTRRAEPITKRTAKNGAVSYEFRADVGTKPDGSRDRRRFTYRTLAEARRYTAGSAARSRPAPTPAGRPSPLTRRATSGWPVGAASVG